jgi:hypothetical protein
MDHYSDRFDSWLLFLCGCCCIFNGSSCRRYIGQWKYIYIGNLHEKPEPDIIHATGCKQPSLRLSACKEGFWSMALLTNSDCWSWLFADSPPNDTNV